MGVCFVGIANTQCRGRSCEVATKRLAAEVNSNGSICVGLTRSNTSVTVRGGPGRGRLVDSANGIDCCGLDTAVNRSQERETIGGR